MKKPARKVPNAFGLPDRFPKKPGGTPRGRKSRYTVDLAERFLAALACGVGFKTAALACGMSEEAPRLWAERIPEFAMAIDQMRANAVLECARALHGYATIPQKDSGPAVTAAKYFLSVRAPEDWRERHGLDISGSVTSMAELAGDPGDICGILPGDTADDD